MAESKSELTIVTAFFDINREKFKTIKRSKSAYLDYFNGWARATNKMVVFTDAETAQKVKEIRASYGLADRTTIHIVGNFRKIEPELYKAIDSAMQGKWLQGFAVNNQLPEIREVDYNYVTMLKLWCMKEAKRLGYIESDGVAWVDFGFNGRIRFFDGLDTANWTWKYDVKDKVYLSKCRDLNEWPIFEVIRRSLPFIQATVFVINKGKIDTFYEMQHKHVLSLSDAGLACTEQTIWLMCYRENPDIFVLGSDTRWGSALAEFNDNPPKFTDKQKQRSLLYRMVRQLRYIKFSRQWNRIAYSIRTFFVLGERP